MTVGVYIKNVIFSVYFLVFILTSFFVFFVPVSHFSFVKFCIYFFTFHCLLHFFLFYSFISSLIAVFHVLKSFFRVFSLFFSSHLTSFFISSFLSFLRNAFQYFVRVCSFYRHWTRALRQKRQWGHVFLCGVEAPQGLESKGSERHGQLLLCLVTDDSY